MSVSVRSVLETGQEHPTSVMLFPIFFLISMGFITNIVNASGLLSNNAQYGYMGLDGQYHDYPCVLGQNGCSMVATPKAVGCQLDINNCKTSSITAVSFFNNNSIVVALISGNIGLFISDLINIWTNPLNNWGTLWNFLSFALGVIFLALSTGVGLAIQALATGLSLSINEQGSRMAQAIGIGLIIWSISSELEGNWLSYLGWGLGGLVNMLLMTMFFFGLYWRLFSYQ